MVWWTALAVFVVYALLASSTRTFISPDSSEFLTGFYFYSFVLLPLVLFALTVTGGVLSLLGP